MSLCNKSSVYSGTQTSTFLQGGSTVVLGRCDGTLSAYKTDPSVQLVATSVVPSAAERVGGYVVGVNGVAALDDNNLLVSGKQSIEVYEYIEGRGESTLRVCTSTPFDSELGVVCSAVYLPRDNIILTGHENGYVASWSYSPNTRELNFNNHINVSGEALAYGLKKVRALVATTHGDTDWVISGGSDGRVCSIKPNPLEMVEWISYSPNPQRGINSVAVQDGIVLVGNCAVGHNDSNLWMLSFDGASGTFTREKCLNLKVNKSAEQVFTFSVAMRPGALDTLEWYASTQEAVIWNGLVTKSSLSSNFHTKINLYDKAEIGYHLSLSGDTLIAAAGNVEQYQLPLAVEKTSD